MPLIVYVLQTGERRSVAAEPGTSVMRAAVDNLVPGIVAECGGEMSCATCHVYVDEAWAGRFPPRAPEEEEMLEVTAAEPNEFSRLSCQLECSEATDGVVVYIPDLQ